MDASCEQEGGGDVKRIAFGIIGGGWRAEFFLRIAHACPGRFSVTGMVVRDAGKGEAMEARWGLPTFCTADQMLDRTSPSFVVTCVPRAANADILVALAKRGMPALSETPPAADHEGLCGLYEAICALDGRVQVAEQYHLQPMHQARLGVAASGRLGSISQAQVSIAHGYHGISLMRRFLGVAYEEATIHAFAFSSPVVAGPGRSGPPDREVIRASKQELIRFDYGDRLGWFDFCGDQYHSWVRRNRLLVRGERGEMDMHGAAYLKDYLTPIQGRFVRHVAGADGNLEGLYLKGVQFGEEWLYRNPFAPAPLTDDEIAVAECLVGMDRYLETGQAFYSLAEACQDHYLSLMAAKAAEIGEAVRTSRQPWAC